MNNIVGEYLGNYFRIFIYYGFFPRDNHKKKLFFLKKNNLVLLF